MSYLCLRGGKEQETTDSHIKNLHFLGLGCLRAGWMDRGVFGSEGRGETPNYL